MLIPGCSIIPAASFSECRHGGLTGGLVAARRRAILIDRDCFRSEHLETLEAVLATALNIVKNRTLADLYVRRDYTGEFRIRVQLESGQRYVITIKEE